MWKEALQAVQLCSLNVAQLLSQLYIILRVHSTPERLYSMGLRENIECTRCSRDHGDLIHLLWCCLKLHLYCSGVVATIIRVFLVNILMDPKPCIFRTLDDLPIWDNPKQAIAKALFQACKPVLRKRTEPPTLWEWITQMGDTLRLERYIFQHQESSMLYGLHG